MLTTYVESTLQMELFFYYEIQKFIMNILKSVKLAVSISLTIFQEGTFKFQPQKIASTLKLNKEQNQLRAECPNSQCSVN